MKADVTVPVYKKAPRLAMISSLAGLGHVSLTAALPVVSVLGVQPCPLPSSILSGHLAYPQVCKTDLTEQLAEYLSVWERLDTRFDGLYIGYLANAAQTTTLQEILKNVRFHEKASSAADAPCLGRLLASHARILVDPVMADHGKPYSTVTTAHIIAMKELVTLADVLTPNLTEACLLTDTPYQEENWTAPALTQLCKKLDPDCRKIIVVTGVPLETTAARIGVLPNGTVTPIRVSAGTPDCYQNFLWAYGRTSSVEYESAGASRPGTGDIFASILAAHMVLDHDMAYAVNQATEFISACIADSEAAEIPVREGVLLEQNLYRLMQREATS